MRPWWLIVLSYHPFHIIINYRSGYRLLSARRLAKDVQFWYYRWNKEFPTARMPFGKTARIQAADRQFGKHLNQIKKISENELHRETKCIEDIFRIDMVCRCSAKLYSCLIIRLSQYILRADGYGLQKTPQSYSRGLVDVLCAGWYGFL